jgi:hypothetical protein
VPRLRVLPLTNPVDAEDNLLLRRRARHASVDVMQDLTGNAI